MKTSAPASQKTPPLPTQPRAKTAPASLKKAAPQTTFQRLFGIDPRSLALFRIGIGVLLLADLAVRAMDLRAMYTDEGMFPRADLLRIGTVWNWSLHFKSGAFGFEAMLFAVAAVFGLAFLVGFKTRIATIASWILLLSVQHRSPAIISGADILLRALLFWAMFLPLECAWSLDRRKKPRTEEDVAPIVSVATIAILLQMALMYLFSAYFKTNADWTSGKAIEGSLHHSLYASPLAARLLQFPLALKWMTWGTLALEWVGPFLLFSPGFTGRLRLATVALLAAMHIGIALTMQVGFFSFIAIFGLCLFLPRGFWESRWFARFATIPLTETKQAFAKKESLALGYLAQAACLVFLLFVLAVNLNGLPSQPLKPMTPEKFKPLTVGAGLWQRWGMFEQIPSQDGWYVARAKLNDGTEIDLLRDGAAIDWNRPPFPALLYPNHNWQKLFREMSYADQVGYQMFRKPVSEYLCRRWNEGKPTERQIAEFDLVFSKDTENGAALPQIQRESFAHLDFKGK